MPLPDSLTGDEVKDILKKRGVTRLEVRDCSICGFKLHYIIRDDWVAFNAGCHCTGGERVEQRGFGDIANMYNMQDNDKARTRMLALIKGVEKGKDNDKL